MQLPALSIDGDPREIGRSLGKHASRELRACFAEPQLAAGIERWRGSRQIDELRTRATACFPDGCAELSGIAEGAGLPVEDVFIFNVLADLPGPPPPESGCTTFLLPATASDPAVIAHNEDACLITASFWFMARVRRTHHPAFTALCYAGRLPGHTFATNDYGLVQTINDIRALERRPGVPRCFLARAILDCRDVESALDLIRRTARAGGYHHSLACSSDARLYSVEAPPGAIMAVEVTRPLVHANHLIHGPLAALPQYIVGGSVFRQNFGEQVLDTVRRDPIQALRARSETGRSLMQSPEAANDWHETVASAVFEIDAQGVKWRAHDTQSRVLHSECSSVGATGGLR